MIVAVCLGSIGAFATPIAETDYLEIVPLWTHIVLTSNNLRDLGGGRLSIQGGTTVQLGFTAGVTVELQQNGRTIRTWSDARATNINLATEHFVARGHQYRLRLTHTARNANGAILETVVMYSRTVVVN